MIPGHEFYGNVVELGQGAAEKFNLRIGDRVTAEQIVPCEECRFCQQSQYWMCAVYTVQRVDIDFEDILVLAGAGSLGLCIVQLIALKTPKKLIVLDLEDWKLEKAKKLGADICINPAKEDSVNEIKKLTDNYGCNVYIEATRSPSGVTQGLDMIRKLGRFVEFSVFTNKANVDWSIIGDRKELD